MTAKPLPLLPPKPVRGWLKTRLYDSLVADPKWIAEPKADGDRCLVVVVNGRVSLQNRYGGLTRYPWLGYLRKELEGWGLPDGCVLDCELLHEPKPNQDLVVFDVPSAGGTLAHRRKVLETLFADEEFQHVRLVPWYVGDAKRKAFRRALRDGAEGVVFKRLDSKYQWQRTSGMKIPTWVKVKNPRHYEIR